MNWQPGFSGNPAGRPKGCNDKQPRRRRKLDPADAASWSQKQWLQYHAKLLRDAAGSPAQKQLLAFNQIGLMFTGLRLAKISPGQCTCCLQPFQPNSLSPGLAPVKIAENLWMHHGCSQKYYVDRWREAVLEVKKLGIQAY